MKVLSKHQILLLHEQLIDETGGSPGLRDEGLLIRPLTHHFRGLAAPEPTPLSSRKPPGSVTVW